MITLQTYFNGFKFSLNDKAMSVREIKESGNKPTEYEVVIMRDQVQREFSNNSFLFDGCNNFIDQLVQGNMLSDVMPLHRVGYSKSKIEMYPDGVARFYAYINTRNGGRRIEFTTRRVVNDSVLVNKIKYKLDEKLKVVR